MTRAAVLKSSVRVAVLALVVGFVATPLAAGAATTRTAPRQWAAQGRLGDVQLKNEVPLLVDGSKGSTSLVHLIGRVSAPAELSLNFGLPITNITGLNALIVAESRTHRQMSRAQIYARFSPPQAQYNALRTWLQSQGFTVTHVGRDRLEMTAKAPASTIERALHVTLNAYRERTSVVDGITVPAHDIYSNVSNPIVPARLGIQTVTGLSNVGQFFTDLQLQQHTLHPTMPVGGARGGAGRVNPHTRSPGYYPRDLRSMYDVTNVDNYGTGQTIGFTLWGAGEVQAALTAFATTTGETALTDDTPCVATGSPTTPSSCTTIHESSNHLLNVLENGNTNNNYGGNAETGLDVEVSHGMAPGVAEKYYLADCSTTPSPGLTNGGSCNGSDVGLEDSIEDSANDPTLHSVSDSWGYGPDPEGGASDPFIVATNNNQAIAAAAGTTFYCATGDSGDYWAGYPCDSPYVVGVGGSSIFSTATQSGSSTATLSSEDLWAAGGTWCSNVQARPSWQTGAGVAANADCPGRAIPDLVADADTNTAVEECYSRTATTDSCGGVGGTSVAAPI
ncbi:MAG TPA: protease pro-enzyme activation domain-containing protein, partial [Acidimicrobiales bacterium]|nr:protease pro-enzyme activation domain-containing protein [Acidimicrobiales bacterium]